MDATTRWETEAIRSGGGRRKGPPRPSSKRDGDRREWVTLKEAEAATGIPSNTLRKWVRKSGLPSYLESDGDFALRMVDLEAVRERASELGRTVSPQPEVIEESDAASAPRRPSPPVEPTQSGEPVPEGEPEPATPTAPPGTMIVPIDAWNKMLGQLGNLHEAGQQLAEARERAAKAETEAEFLRRRLAELRTEFQPAPANEPEPAAPEPVEPEEPRDPPPPETTTYWRYVTSGWRNRRRRQSGS